MRELATAGGYDFTEVCTNATFAGAKKGAPPLASPSKGQGTKIITIPDGAYLPLGVTVASADPAETALVDVTLEARFLRRKIPD